MGTRRKRERQQDLWIATSDVVETPGNAFYDRLNEILDEHKFDAKVERLCQKYYQKSPYGRPSISPGVRWTKKIPLLQSGEERRVVFFLGWRR